MKGRRPRAEIEYYYITIVVYNYTPFCIVVNALSILLYLHHSALQILDFVYLEYAVYCAAQSYVHIAL